MRTIKKIYIVGGLILLLVLYGLFATIKAVYSVFFKFAPIFFILYGIFKLYKVIINVRKRQQNNFQNKKKKRKRKRK